MISLEKKNLPFTYHRNWLYIPFSHLLLSRLPQCIATLTMNGIEPMVKIKKGRSNG